MDERNIILIPIEQGSTNPIKPKINGSIIVAYKDNIGTLVDMVEDSASNPYHLTF
jgi:hypothetical protein